MKTIIISEEEIIKYKDIITKNEIRIDYDNDVKPPITKDGERVADFMGGYITACKTFELNNKHNNK